MAVAERFQGANVVDAGKLSPYWGEHAARYRFAWPYVDGRAVLDIACGTGYGIGLLKENARFVVGVDVDLSAAKTARSEVGKNSTVLLGDGLALPFADNSFDVITSFETLEHLHARQDFLLELKRVLRPEGMLLLSTPNALYTRPVDGKPTNPFHVFEYTPDELRSEIAPLFSIEKMLGQRLDTAVRISPFYIDQQRLPRTPAAQAMLLGWKVLNKLPFAIREGLSEAIWRKPFYPTEADYNFSDQIDLAPVQLVVCRPLWTRLSA
jgi:ubiquinone/menaquinone biosynthesis C-methylase UbiE